MLSGSGSRLNRQFTRPRTGPCGCGTTSGTLGEDYPCHIEIAADGAARQAVGGVAVNPVPPEGAAIRPRESVSDVSLKSKCRAGLHVRRSSMGSH